MRFLNTTNEDENFHQEGFEPSFMVKCEPWFD